jgi:hypothetical protein
VLPFWAVARSRNIPPLSPPRRRPPRRFCRRTGRRRIIHLIQYHNMWTSTPTKTKIIADLPAMSYAAHRPRTVAVLMVPLKVAAVRHVHGHREVLRSCHATTSSCQVSILSYHRTSRLLFLNFVHRVTTTARHLHHPQYTCCLSYCYSYSCNLPLFSYDFTVNGCRGVGGGVVVVAGVGSTHHSTVQYSTGVVVASASEVTAGVLPCTADHFFVRIGMIGDVIVVVPSLFTTSMTSSKTDWLENKL